MNQTVVIAVTGDAADRRAVEWGARHASRDHDRVVLLSVVGKASGIGGEEPVIASAVDATQALLDEYADTVRERGVQCTTGIDRGKPVERFIEASRNSDLLVIGGSHPDPERGHDRVTPGMRVAAGASCTVVVVPDVDMDDRSGVVVGVDGSPTSEAALRFAAREADRTQEPLTVISTWSPVYIPLHVKSYPGSYLENMQKMAEETLGIALAGLSRDYPDLVVRRVVESGYPETVINAHAATARLAVVGSHGRGAVARFLLGSTSQAVLAQLATVTAVVR